MSCEQLFDLVTGLYLDCWNDGEVADVLTREFGERVDSHVVSGIRAEAAVAADHQPEEVRRRWIYRYQTVTVNNLVKEYMFMEKKKRFIEAKRELADEIDALVGSTAPERLCIAVNDALGRNNIGMEHIRELQDYALRFRKLLVAVTLYADREGCTPERGLQSVAEKVEKLLQGKCDSDVNRAALMLAGVLGTDHIRYDPADVTFLVEYRKLSGDDGNYPLMIKLLRGADLPPRHTTALDQIIAGTAKHLSFEDLQDLIQYIRARPVMTSEILSHVHRYAERHRKDLETLKELGIRQTAQGSATQAEALAVRQLRALAEQHVSLLQAARFVGDVDARKAAKVNISPTDLQIILDRINGMTHEHQIRDFVEGIRTTRQFAFPVERYLAARFTLPVA